MLSTCVAEPHTCPAVRIHLHALLCALSALDVPCSLARSIAFRVQAPYLSAAKLKRLAPAHPLVPDIRHRPANSSM